MDNGKSGVSLKKWQAKYQMLVCKSYVIGKLLFVNTGLNSAFLLKNYRKVQNI